MNALIWLHRWVGAVLGIVLVVLALAALLWFGTLQTAWFVQHLKCSRLRAFGHASRAMVESLVAVLLLANLFS